MAAPPLPAEVRRLLQDQAPSSRTRTNLFDPSAFVSRHGRPYSSRRIPISTLMEMRTDAIMRFAQIVALVSIFTAKWKIECVAEGEPVLMADGTLKPVENISVGDEVLSSDGESIKRDRVTDAWPVGERECLRVTFTDGRQITVTPNHPIYGWRGWKFAGDLELGDAVCFAHETLDSDSGLSREDAFLLALWLAEGSKSKASYEISCGTPGIHERLREIAATRGWTYSSWSNNLVALVGANWQRGGGTPKNLLREHGCWGQTTKTISIPDAVMSASREVVGEFLATYVACDGCVTQTGINIVSTSERMARDLQILFARIGAHAYIQTRQPAVENHSLQWVVVVGSDGVRNLTNLAYIYGKQERAIATISQKPCSAVVPPQWFSELPTPEYAGVGRPASPLKATRKAGLHLRKEAWTSLRTASQAAEICGVGDLAKRLSGHLGWTRVRKIEPAGRRRTYDLEVADNHTFFVGGVLVHNCANARKAAFIDQALRRIIGRLIVQYFESWNFGWQAMVKEFGLMVPGWTYIDVKADGGPKSALVWDEGGLPALVWEPFVPLRPQSVAPVWTAGGDFNGIAIAKTGTQTAYAFPTLPLSPADIIDIPADISARFTDDDQQQKVDVAHSLWVTNERDAQFGSIWGYPRLGYAYKYWWAYEMTFGILQRAIERHGDPTIVVSYPQGSSMVDGAEVPNQTIAFQIGESGRSGSILAVPSEVWGEDMATANQAAKWKIEYLKPDADFDKLLRVLEYYDTMRFRSMMVSELAIAEGSGGCLDGYTPILCPRDHSVYPDGVPLEDIEPGRLVWAFNQESMKFELWPVKGVWCTMDDADLYKLTLDNGQTITGTPDHPFMSRDGVWRRMDELKPGDRLMPFYESGKQISYSGTKLPPGDYEPMVLLDPDYGSFEVEYRVIGDHVGWTGQGKKVNIHHDDGRHANTELENLHCLTPGQHATKHFRDPVHRQKHSDAVRAAMASLPPEQKSRMSKEHWDEERWKAFAERQAIVGLDSITKFRDSLTPEEYKAWCTSRAKATQDARKRNGTVSVPPRDKRTCRGCSKDFQPISSNSWYCQTCNETRNTRKTERLVDYQPGEVNHRVVSVERLDETGMVWDLEIDGPEHVRSFVANGVVVHNTSSRNVAAETGQRTAESQIFAQAELDEIINRYMIPQLADANFPELKDEPARKVTQAFGQDEAQLAADLLRSFANSDADKLPLDKVSLLNRFQIDTLEGEQLDRWQADLVKQAEQSAPPPASASPNGAAGVTDTGFYYDAPERIELSGDESMLASLPKTKHYSDSAVIAQARLVRKLYRDLLADQYEDFAEHIARMDDISLAEDEADKAADRIVRGWRFVGASAAKTVKTVFTALEKVLARAGVLELAASRIPVDAWKPEDKALKKWASNNAAALVRSVDDTTRKQLRDFLASELRVGNQPNVIAEHLREHFSSFPDWRADLIAREETKRYYNAGTLFAAEQAGATQVQALDARGAGPTDEECVHRNGRVFDVSDAWSETEREHVRGTLSWRIIPREVQLSFARQTREQMSDTAARFDQEERTIYLVEGLDPVVEGQYLERAVDWLIASR